MMRYAWGEHPRAILIFTMTDDDDDDDDDDVPLRYCLFVLSVFAGRFFPRFGCDSQCWRLNN